MLIGTALSLAAVVIFLAIPLHYGPQKDVIFPRPTQSN